MLWGNRNGGTLTAVKFTICRFGGFRVCLIQRKEQLIENEVAGIKKSYGFPVLYLVELEKVVGSCWNNVGR